jgi:DNA-binding MarR family transcriptional regulator
MRIFLSHRSRDTALVREFKEMLPSFLNTWLDEDSLSWGESFPAELKSTIQSGIDFLIIFLDKDALNSKWVMQELEWAIQRERELKRTFILPIMLEMVASEDLPTGFSERLFLLLSDFTHSSVEELAKRATMKLFQLVVESYSSLQLEAPSRKALISVRDGLSAGQAKLLGYLVEKGKNGNEIPQRQLEQGMGYSLASAELYYRLESLIQQGFVRKRRISTDGQFSYALTEEFRSQIDKA